MARVAVWLSGCSAAHPLLAAPAAGRLRGGMGAFARMLRDLTRRGCPSAARQRVASSTAHPANAPPQVCPAGVADCRVAFLLGTFLWRSKEQVPRPPGRDPASGLKKSTPSTTKTITTSALQISARAQKHQKKTHPSKKAENPTPTPAPTPYAPRPQPGRHGAFPPGCAPPAWRRSTPYRPHTAPKAHPASWHPARPSQCSPPA